MTSKCYVLPTKNDGARKYGVDYIVEPERAAQILRHSAVGATLEGAALSVLRNVEFGVVLLDEAAQTLEVKDFVTASLPTLDIAWGGSYRLQCRVNLRGISGWRHFFSNV